MRVAAKAIFSRILLVLFGLGLSLVVMEGVLRVGARFVGGESAVHSAWLGKWRLLAVGDSNTYGLYVDKSQAYPQVFESLWNAMPGTALGPVDVLNLGFPSTNSSKLATDFRRMLWMFRPDVVTVMIGVNDRWTLPETAAQSPNRLDRLAAWLWKRARAYRFLYMVRQAFRSRHLEVAYDPSNTVDHGRGTARYGQDELELGWREIPRGGVPGLQPGVELQKDLQSVAAQAAEFGARLVFLTYAGDSGFYAWANDGIRAAAKATATPLIDVAAALKPACPLPAGTDRLDAPAPTCPELFPDQHPTVLGHKRIAQILTQQLLPALQEAR